MAFRQLYAFMFQDKKKKALEESYIGQLLSNVVQVGLYGKASDRDEARLNVTFLTDDGEYKSRWLGYTYLKEHGITIDEYIDVVKQLFPRSYPHKFARSYPAPYVPFWTRKGHFKKMNRIGRWFDL